MKQVEEIIGNNNIKGQITVKCYYNKYFHDGKKN